MIAGENDHKDIRIIKVIQGMIVTVNPGQVEKRSFLTPISRGLISGCSWEKAGR